MVKLIEVSFSQCVLRKKKKVIGHDVHQKNSIYWIPKIDVKNNFDWPKN